MKNFYPLLQKRYTKWNDLEIEISKIKETTEKGNIFEQFSYFYFLYFKDLYQISEIWNDKVRGREIPIEIKKKYKIESKDNGIDGISLLADGTIEAWQAKFREYHSSPTARELATFWSESEYVDSRRIIANCTVLPNVADKKRGHKQILLDKFVTLDQDFFDALYKFANTLDHAIARIKYLPRDHQKRMINDVVNGLKAHDRGKLIAACGTGKTLAALWITEDDALNINKVIILMPSIDLVGQTLRQWVTHKNKPFNYLCVCSDKTVERDVVDDIENFDIQTSELGVNVTTTKSEVIEWLKKTHGTRQYIFSTYHSISVISEAVKELEDYYFDIAIMDEAHRTVGRSDQLFSLSVKDEVLPSKKRLFMTATEKLVNPRIQTYAKKSGFEVFSMENESIYGPTLHSYTFGQAIKENVIADYEIILAEVKDGADKELIEVNRLIELEAKENDLEPLLVSSEILFKTSFLIKAIIENISSKIITFHNTKKRAATFENCVNFLGRRMSSSSLSDLYSGYVIGTQNSAERAERIEFFEAAKRGILCNVQVLSEGVDVPIIDSVYFVDPKSSLIDIVQAIGRALRKPSGIQSKKISKIIIPIIIPPNTTNLDEINWDETLMTFHSVIQAMRDQDHRLSDQINEMNLFIITNGKKGRKLSYGNEGKIRVMLPSNISLPEKIDIDTFLQKITLRIATANANPENGEIGFSRLGKGQRKSEYKPNFGILGDYNPEIYRDELVIPTINRFAHDTDMVPRTNLVVNHNNLSHALRLGVIKVNAEKLTKLTPLGKALKNNEISFENLFKNQMLLYSINNTLFPYRSILQILLELDSLSHIEFLYGPYIMKTTESGEFDVNSAIKRIIKMRELYPNLDVANISNREHLRLELNEQFAIDIPEHDVWSDRSTPKNKFRYLKNGLSLFDCMDNTDRSYRIPILLKNKEMAKELLRKSDTLLSPDLNYYGSWIWL